MNAIINVATIATRSAMEGSRKKVARVMALKSHNGANIVVNSEPGILDIGMWKCACRVDLLYTFSYLTSSISYRWESKHFIEYHVLSNSISVL